MKDYEYELKVNNVRFGMNWNWYYAELVNKKMSIDDYWELYHQLVDYLNMEKNRDLLYRRAFRITYYVSRKINEYYYKKENKK